MKQEEIVLKQEIERLSGAGGSDEVGRNYKLENYDDYIIKCKISPIVCLVYPVYLVASMNVFR